jgi:hypothetical protein
MTSKESHDAVDCHYAFLVLGAEGWVIPGEVKIPSDLPSWRMTSVVGAG